MADQDMSKVLHPLPKMSMGSKARKTIHYLQKLKDEGTKIVQHCPAMLSPIFTFAADMAGVDINRLPPGQGAGADESLRVSSTWIASWRQMAPRIHINYVADTITFAKKEEGLANFARFHSAGADSILPMGVNNETLKFVADNYCTIYGHVGAISGWQTLGAFGGYKRLGKTAEDALKVFKMAYEYQENGMKAMSIELVPIEVTNIVAKKLHVPVIGIAAGGAADGSEMVDADTFGLMAKPASHAKTYASLVQFAMEAYGKWANDVRTGVYPTDDTGFHMDEAELSKFVDAVEKF
ncbi:MAG: 3-methyl-2-oxobutanoate hydroxymethyltransferase [Lachnospiraceae bacterium]|jgi:3-methyl-2-oxobutanoate hydroxymethyltransferase|nr:3-methyl-2-oxobutanoate hydroxymethyltransferase [Lachnospiraceae bacterium]